MSEGQQVKKKASLYDRYFSGEWTEEDEAEVHGSGKEVYGLEKDAADLEEKRSELPVQKKREYGFRGSSSGAIGKAQDEYIKKQLEIQDREKCKRENLRKKAKAQKQRKTTRRAVMKRTKKGQPVMHLQINQLLNKIQYTPETGKKE